MTQVINTNMPSLAAQRNLENSNTKMATCLQRLSSGLRINSAKDDAAGLSIATRMQSSISGLTVASRNSNDAISLAQIAEGALQETTTILQRARELAVQSANGTNASTDRQALQSEVNQIKSSMSNIASTTTFNGLNLLDGSLAAAQFQVGANQNQTVVVSIADTRTNQLGSNNLTINNADSILQANYETYQESNGSGMDILAGTTNGIAIASSITLTPIQNDGQDSLTPVTIAPSGAGITAATLASEINANAGGLAKASAFNAVRLSGFTISANTLTIGIKNAGATVNAPALSTVNVTGTTPAARNSQIATIFNSDAGMQSNGCYAIASDTNVTIISPTGCDISVTSANASTSVVMQPLNSTGGIRGGSLTPSNSAACCAGVLSLETQQNVKTTFGNTAIFNAAAQTKAGVRNTQTVNRVGAQNINIAGNQGSSLVAIAANQSAASIAVAINAKTSTTGVSATASTTATIQNLRNSSGTQTNLAGTVQFNLKGDNAAAIKISAEITPTDFTQLIQSINDVSGTTGITATTGGSNAIVVLTNALGNDIQITDFTHSAAVVAKTVSSATPIVGDGNGNGSSGILALPTFVSVDVVGNTSVLNSGGTAPLTSAVTLYSGGMRNNVNSTVVGGELKFTSSASFAASSNVNGVTYSGSLFAGIANLSNSAKFASVNLIDVSTSEGAQSAISVIDQALNQVSAIRASLGAIQSRFESTIRNLSNNIENLQSAMSRIMDADFAAETANLTKAQILTQAGISILSQANAIPQSVLKLLG